MQRGLVTGIEYSVKENERGEKSPTVFLYIRAENGKRYTYPDTSFEPYFYIPADPYWFNKLTMLQNMKWDPVDYYSYIYREPLRKIYVDIPGSVGAVRRGLDKWRVPTFEADVLFVLRYLIDKEIYAHVEFDIEEKTLKPLNDIELNIEPRVATIDIEAMADETSEQVNVKGPEPVCCVTIHRDNPCHMCTVAQLIHWITILTYAIPICICMVAVVISSKYLRTNTKTQFSWMAVVYA